MKKVVLEALIVAMVGVALGFCANALSPKGISLTQDFFHSKSTGKTASTVSPSPTNTAPRTAGGTNALREELAARLREHGLGLVEGARVNELFNDPRRTQNLIVFVDARDDTHYQAGHIPGAYQFNYFEAAKYLASVIPAVQSAEQVVVYCEGGKCEDSLHAALNLGEFIPKDKLLVYAGGITEWIAQGHEVESGERNSGVLRSGIAPH